ncbi:hypothetical protein FD755_014659 [Muntiacus reevesi]|uniref:Uncharacterized protein n=1 Tax=Muntiacus reevesi TaxID=9886 RepID=A0A5N3XL92_MUNRE|nr:hypothetical protein FD755_014659 [Muntiacus reevesi]
MSTTGSFEGFQPVSLKREEDDQPSETDQLSMEEREPDTEVPAPKQISRLPSVIESTLYPNPYHKPYLSRKYFVTRPGVIETAMEDLKGHITKTSGETIQGFWLLTERWPEFLEEFLLVTERSSMTLLLESKVLWGPMADIMTKFDCYSCFPDYFLGNLWSPEVSAEKFSNSYNLSEKSFSLSPLTKIIKLKPNLQNNNSKTKQNKCINTRALKGESPGLLLSPLLVFLME